MECESWTEQISDKIIPKILFARNSHSANMKFGHNRCYFGRWGIYYKSLLRSSPKHIGNVDGPGIVAHCSWSKFVNMQIIRAPINLCFHENDCCGSVLSHIYQHLANTQPMLCIHLSEAVHAKPNTMKIDMVIICRLRNETGELSHTRTVPVIIITYVLILWTGACFVYACFQRSPYTQVDVPELRSVLTFYLLLSAYIRNHTSSCDTHLTENRKIYWRIYGLCWVPGTGKISLEVFLRSGRTHFKDKTVIKTKDNLFSNNSFMIILSESFRSKWKCHFPFILLLSGCHRQKKKKTPHRE